MIYALTAGTITALVGSHVAVKPVTMPVVARASAPQMVVNLDKGKANQYISSNLPPALRAQLGLFTDDEDDTAAGIMYDGLPSSDQQPNEIIWDLSQGNQNYVKGRLNPAQYSSEESLVQSLIADSLNPKPVKALVVSCARSYAPVDTIFDASAGELQHLRLCGNVVGKNDGTVGSIEFALARSSPKVILVLANSNNDVIMTAVYQAMEDAGLQVPPKTTVFREGVEVSDLELITPVVSSARDAILSNPKGNFDEFCEETAKLNAYKSIENLFASSRIAVKRVIAGELSVEAAYFNVETGAVSMMGKHPSEVALRATLPPGAIVRTGKDPPVPADEAIAAIYSGNKRYATGNGGVLQTMDETLMKQLDTAGQRPVSIILGCADSRAPIEIMFDVRPGDLFVLRNAGNSVASYKGSIIGSAEYAIGVLGVKLLCVTGHTKCGALTAAVNTVLAGGDTDAAGGSISIVLEDIIDPAKEAVALLPDATVAEQIQLGIKINIFATMKKMIEQSEMTRTGVEKGDLRLIGAMYDIYTGDIEWMGDHPDTEKIVGKELPYWRWKMADYSPNKGGSSSNNPKVENALQKLKRGNARFKNGAGQLVAGSPEVPDPFAIVIGGGEVRVPIEKMFDVKPGELIVQRVMGNIAGRPGASLVNSIDFAVARYDPKLLVVLGDGQSRIIKTALAQTTGAEVPSPALQYIVDRVMVSAIRAKQQVEKGAVASAASRDLLTQRLTVELNVLYTIEQLCRSSIVRAAVKDGLEMHGAILNAQTGQVDFIGQHPALDAYIDEAMYE